MNNNPMQFLLNAMRRNGDPRQMLSQMARTDPMAQQVERILGGKSPQQQREIVTNMYRERGVNLEDVARSLGISIPSQR